MEYYATLRGCERKGHFMSCIAWYVRDKEGNYHETGNLNDATVLTEEDKNNPSMKAFRFIPKNFIDRHDHTYRYAWWTEIEDALIARVTGEG